MFLLIVVLCYSFLFCEFMFLLLTLYIVCRGFVEVIVSYVVPSRPLFRKSRDVLLDCIVYQDMYLLCFVYLLTAALFSLITLFV